MSDQQVSQFEINRYGIEQRFSFLADLLELEALQSKVGASRPKNELGDFINDASLAKVLRNSVFERENDFDEVEDDLAQGNENELVERVFTQLEERAFILEDSYPFIIRGERLRRRDQFSEIHGPYLGLLDHTLAHHFLTETFDRRRPTESFEELVVLAFRAEGLVSSGLMTSAGNFAQRLEQASQTLESVSFSKNGTLIRRSAQDGKVDLLAIENFGRDTRAARGLVLGQVTCAKSEQWEKKRDEPKPEMWKRLTKDIMSPRACLIVPHHAEREHLEFLSQNDLERPVYDRLRICRMLSKQEDRTMAEPGAYPQLSDFQRFQVMDWGSEV